MTPEIKKLWAAMMVLAYKDARRSGNSDETKRNRMSAIAWFNNMGNTGVGSFLWVCDILKLDPEKTRKEAVS